MKKLFSSILALGLLFSGNAFSQVIIYKKCHLDTQRTFQKKTFEEIKFTIDTNLKTVTKTMILTDENYKIQRQQLISSGKQHALGLVKKVRVAKGSINYLDNEYIKASYNKSGYDYNFTINRKRKTVLSDGGAINLVATWVCS